MHISAQINISKISADIGLIRNMQYATSNEVSRYTLYPELHIGGSLFKKFLEWDLYWGYWNDGVKEEFSIRDGWTFSYSSNLVGTRIYFYPQDAIDDIVFPFKLAAGVSYHFVNMHYVGGTDYVGNIGNDSSIRFLTFDIGLGIDINIIEKISIGIEGDLYFRTDISNSANSDDFSSLKMGLTYRF